MMDPAAFHEATSTVANSIALPASPSLLQLPPTVLRSIQLGGFPALGMFGATQLGLRVPTPPNVLGALQHFAAGILLTTVAKELLPEMVNAQGLYENLASGIGFFSGVGLLIVLGILLPEEDEEEEGEHATSNNAPADSDISVPTTTTATLVPQLPSLRNRKVSRKAGAVARSSSIRNLNSVETAGVPQQQDVTTAPSNDTEANAPILDKYALLPAALLAAVSIDSALDGLLIGTSTALDPSTGTILSASLAVESSFLGLTIGTALQACRQGLLGSSFAPVALLVGALAGGSLAPILSESPVLLAGILGFGTSATLFMVAEELLLESHENGAEHVWWVDFQLYTGFFASVMVDKFI